jgi:hypothetical protein
MSMRLKGWTAYRRVCDKHESCWFSSAEKSLSSTCHWEASTGRRKVNSKSLILMRHMNTFSMVGIVYGGYSTKRLMQRHMNTFSIH